MKKLENVALAKKFGAIIKKDKSLYKAYVNRPEEDLIAEYKTLKSLENKLKLWRIEIKNNDYK